MHFLLLFLLLLPGTNAGVGALPGTNAGDGALPGTNAGDGALPGTCVGAREIYFPPADESGWERTSPASLGYHPDSIAALYDFLGETQTKGFLLLRDGKIVLEKYFGTFRQDSLWYWASAAKSLRATLVGIAREDGKLRLRDTTAHYLGAGWTSLTPEREQAITVGHQLTMTAGLNDFFFDCTTPDCLRYRADAGTRWAYHNAPYSLTKEVLEAATDKDLNAYTRQEIRDPIGMQTGFWYPSGFNTLFISRVRDAARFGHLILAGGRWEGATILGDTAYLRAMLSPSQDLNPAYGYLWWLNGRDRYLLPGDRREYAGPISPAAPADLVLAAGKNGQFIAVVPSEKLVMVRFGDAASEAYAPLDYHDAIWQRLSALRGPTRTRQPAAGRISVYPNPASGELHLALPVALPHTYQIYDGRGRRCRAGTTSGRVRLEALPPGPYLLRLQRGQQQWLARFVKR